MTKYLFTSYLPVILYLALHFGLLSKLSKRKHLLLAITTAALLVLYTLFMYNKQKEWNGYNILSLLPTTYIIIAIVLRYLLFNKYISANIFDHPKAPYDPEIIYPGVFTIYWGNKTYTPNIMEYMYSFGVLLLPWLFLTLV